MSTNKGLPRRSNGGLKLAARKHNAMQKYCQFPTELLSQIFISYRDIQLKEDVSTVNYRRPPRRAISWFAPAHVCGLWREVALGCRELWNTIYLNSVKATNFLIRQSRTAPLHVRFDPSRWTPSPGCITQCLWLVFEQRFRIVSLEFTRLNSMYWINQLGSSDFLTTFSLLRHLQVTSGDLAPLILPNPLIFSRVTDLTLYPKDASRWNRTEFQSLRRLVMPSCSARLVPHIEAILRRHPQLEVLDLGSTEWYPGHNPPDFRPPTIQPVILSSLSELRLNACKMGLYRLLNPIVSNPSRMSLKISADQSDQCLLTELLPLITQQMEKQPGIRSFSLRRIGRDNLLNFSSAAEHSPAYDSEHCILSLWFVTNKYSAFRDDIGKSFDSLFRPLLANVRTIHLDLDSYEHKEIGLYYPSPNRFLGIWLSISSSLTNLNTLQISLSPESQRNLFVTFFSRASKGKMAFPALRHLTLSKARFNPQFNVDGQTHSYIPYAQAISGKDGVMPCSALAMFLAQRARRGRPIIKLVLDECQGLSGKFLATLQPFVGEITYQKGKARRRIAGRI
ncbi:hypothetical protein DL96DRAFT_1820041 [Flagelloscypha sp. PMI_526]|nr:hypothetical protein DL96DRAFT_1820041 [Flagelloscypha sp. PMI_526]